MITIVATSRAPSGACCAYCGRWVRPGGTIHKIDVGRRGGITRHGQGLGEWWCTACATTDDAA